MYGRHQNPFCQILETPGLNWDGQEVDLTQLPEQITAGPRMTKKADKWQWTGIGVSVGASLGMIVGLLTSGGSGIAIGMALGAGVGITVGAALDARTVHED